MKALGILKAVEEQETSHLWLDDGSGYPKYYINEAIAELEELIKPKNCEGCVYGLGIYLPNPCLRCARFTQLKDRYSLRDK